MFEVLYATVNATLTESWPGGFARFVKTRLDTFTLSEVSACTTPLSVCLRYAVAPLK